MINYDEQLFVDQEKKFRGFQKLLQPATRQAIMFIEAPQDMGKSWLVGRMERHCQEITADIPVAQIDFRNPRQAHEIQDSLGLVRLIRNKLGHDPYFNNLNITINSFTEAGPSRDSSGLAALRKNIEASFSLDELKELYFDLGVNYDSLPGETLPAKSRELVNYGQRHNLLRQLIEMCAELRPHIDWWQGLEAWRVTAVPSPSDSDATTSPPTVADNASPIWADSDMERRRAQNQINDAFFECLAQLMADKEHIVLLFDSYEAAPSETIRWLREELLPRLRDGQLKDVTIIVTGRKTPDLSDLNMKHLLVQTSLDPFTEEHVREYFEERRQITGLDLRTITVTSGGVPGALAMMADYAMTTAEDDDDFFSDL